LFVNETRSSAPGRRQIAASIRSVVTSFSGAARKSSVSPIVRSIVVRMLLQRERRR
jgi:hypothetical protein